MFVSVIVDISLERDRNTFTYAVTEELLEMISIGSCVLVPFGKGGRTVKGYVTAVSEETDIPKEKIKYVLSMADKDTGVTGTLIRLAERINKKYGCSMALAMKTVIPVSRKVKEKERHSYILGISDYEASLMMTKLARDKRSNVKLRALKAIAENPGIDRKMLGDIYGVGISSIKALLNDGLIKEVTEKTSRDPVFSLEKKDPVEDLTPLQKSIAKKILDNRDRVHLIHGVTGSGKTEIYIALIKEVIKEERQVIMLVPEIALITQIYSRLYAVFRGRITVINSRMSEGERYDQYLKIKNKEADIVIGPRTALFMPFEDLGLIIMDEEHSPSYKSENVPRYDAHMAALFRKEEEGATVVLGSATPSVESYYKCITGEYMLHSLKERAVMGSSLPDVEIVDLREELRTGNKKIFSRRLSEEIEKSLKKGSQVMLFLNRRGFSGCISCRSCGHVIKCPHCDISLTAHNDGTIKCHYCGYEERLPAKCPKCGSKYIGTFGTGTQKVEYLIKKEFPGAKVLRLDKDTTGRKNSLDETIAAFRDGRGDILIGTQMIANGHDFPNVSLVGILAADLSLYSNDYMAEERTFQLLTQVAGRAGRKDSKGRVIIQTYDPSNYAVVTAAEQDYESFFQKEISFRKALKYPPAGHMLLILVESAAEEKAEEAAKMIFSSIASKKMPNVAAIGPSPANLSRGKDVYRRTIYVKSSEEEILESLMDDVISSSSKGPFRDIHISFDTDPVTSY